MYKMTQLILQPYQIEHYNRICQILDNERGYLDTSDMGLGKTLIAIAVSKTLDLPMVIICPLTMIQTWENECLKYDAKILKIITFQSLRGTVVHGPKHGLLERNGSDFIPTREYINMVMDGILLVFDEIHYVKNVTAQLHSTHQLVKTMMEIPTRSRVALLSALPGYNDTHIESILKICGIIYQDKLYESKNYTCTLKGITEVINKCNEYNPQKTKEILSKIILDRHTIAPTCNALFTKILKQYISSAMSDEENKIHKDANNGFYCMSKKSLQLLNEGLSMLCRLSCYNRESSSALYSIPTGIITRAMMKIDSSKIPTISRLVTETLDNNKDCKVVIYVNYIRHLKLLTESLKSYNPLPMYGRTKPYEREDIIQKFQQFNNNYRLIISITKVGGLGINLDDRDGRFPRYMYILPSYNFIDLHQATGRIARTTTKSLPVIRFIYSKNHQEEAKILDCLIRRSQISHTIIYNSNGITFPGDYPSRIEHDISEDILSQYDDLLINPTDDPNIQTI